MKLKLTQKLAFVFVLFAAAVLVGVNALGYKSGRDALKSTTISELEAIAGEKEAALAAWVEEKQADIAALSIMPSIIEEVSAVIESPPNSMEESAAHARLVAEFKPRVLSGEFLALLLLDPQTGTILAATSPEEEGISKPDRSYFLEGKKTAYITAIYFSSEFQAPAMTASAPVITEDGKLLAVLAGRLNLAELNTIIQRRSGMRETDDAFLVNTSHLAVTQPRFLPDPAVLEQGIHTVPVDLCLQQASGTMFAGDYQNVPVIAAYRWLPERQLCLIVNISQAEALAPIVDFRNNTIWIVLAALMVASVVALALSRTIIRPILSMQTAAQRYARGELDVRLPETRQDELGMLAHEFNRMASALSEKENQVQTHSLELERRVAERTAQLRQSEGRYRSLFENMISGYAYCEMIFDQGQPQDFIYREVNKAFEVLTGLKDVEGRQVSEVIPGIRESNPELFEVYGRVALTGKPEQLETYLGPLHIWFSISVYSPGQNDFVAVFDNITERKQTEKVLRESEELLKKSQAISHVGSWELDFINNRLVWSDEVYRIFGLSVQEFTPTYAAFLEAVHPDDRSAVDEAFSGSIREGRDAHHVLEHRIIRPGSGEIRFIQGKCQNIKDSSGRIVRSVGMVEDITERKQAEATLRESEDRYRDLVENIRDLIGTHDLQGKILSINPAATEMLGFEMDTLLSMNMRDLLVPEQRSRFDDYLAAIQKEGRASGLMLLQTRDGERRIWEYDNTLRTDSASGPLVRALARDVTERKQAEKALKEKERLLSEAQRIGRIGSWSYDILSDNMRFSDEMYRLLDVQPDEFHHNREDFLALVYPSDRPMAARWFGDIKEATQAMHLDFRLFHKNGEFCYLHCTGAVEFDSAAKPSRFIGTAQDVTERRVAEIQIDQQIKRLTALGEIDRAIISTFDQRYTLAVILSHILSQLQVDAVDVLLLDSERNALRYAGGQGFRTRMMESAHVRLGEGHAGRAAKERRMIRIPDLRETTNLVEFNTAVMAEGFVSYIAVPLIVKGNVKGVLEVYQRSVFQPYQDWLEFFNALVGQTAIAVENTSLFANLQTSNQELVRAYDATIEGWSRAMDLRDRETEGHTQRVTKLTLELARSMGIDESKLMHIRRGALLHDIGKLGVPDHILFKPGGLTAEEREIIERHVDFAYEMLAPIPYLKPALNIPYFHHEKWDGTGYPLGLKGEQIPLEARIFTLVDVWDALLSDRPYRKAWSREETIDYIRAQTGIHFDPRVVECFLALIEKGES